MATSFDFGGLLGGAFGGGLSALDDLLTPEQRAAIQQQAGLSAAAALLQAAGPSTTRTSLGQALGSAFTAGQAGMQKGTESALAQMLTRQKLDEAKRARDLQTRIAGILTGEGAPVSAQGEITPTGALAVPGMRIGPTVERAALIGQPVAQPAMSENEIKASQYRRVADVYAAFGKGEDATRFIDMAEKLAPSREEVVGEPIKTATGYVQRTKTGGFKQLPKEFEPASKPTGEPQVVTERASGKQVLVQRYDDGTYKTVEQFGPPRKIERVDVGGSIQFVDMDAVRPGTTLGKTLAPQVVGNAETGLYVLGGGGGAAPRAPAAGGVAPAAPAGGAAPAAAAAAPAAAGPATAGLQPVIPGTGPKPTEDQSKSAGFALRMNQATQIFNQPIVDPTTNRPVVDANGKPLTLEQAFGQPSRTQAILRSIPSAGATTGIANYFETEGRQQYRQAQENWVTANLRAESGAVIGVDEMQKEIEKYFPKVDDKPKVIQQKAEARRAAEIAMQVRSGPAYKTVRSAAAAGRGRLVTDPATGITRYVEE
jgi:hypothetical protein